MTTAIEDKLLEAMKIPRRFRLTVWDQALQEHKRHASFRVQSWAYTLEYGFTCECSGVEQEWRIFIGDLKLQLPAALESLQRLYRHHGRVGQKLVRRARLKAEQRAKALLHRYLTREQRQELRATKAFTMKGGDGRTYHVTTGSCANVFTEHEGQRYRLCVVPKEWLPTLDTMLAQKVMLETDPEAFLRLAKVTNMVTDDYYESGGFLCGDEPKITRRGTLRERMPLVELTQEQIQNPREWVEARFAPGVPPQVEMTIEEAEALTVGRVETRDA